MKLKTPPQIKKQRFFSNDSYNKDNLLAKFIQISVAVSYKTQK